MLFAGFTKYLFDLSSHEPIDTASDGILCEGILSKVLD